MAAYFEELELALHHAEQALDLTRDLQHPQVMARHLSILAYIYLKQRAWDKVEAYAAEASRLYTDSGKLVLADDSQRALGFGQILAGKPQEALATLQKTAAFSHQIGNLWGEAECAWKLAYTWLELGDYGQVVRFARKGVQLVDKLGLQPMNTLALSVWGTVQRTMLALGGARKTFLEGLINSEAQQLIEVVLDWALTELCAVHALAGGLASSA